MTLRLENGTVDPVYRLAYGDAEDMLGDAQPTSGQIDRINAAIEDYAAADPAGSSDYETERLRLRVARILEESDHD